MSLSAHGRLTVVAAVAAWLSVLPLFTVTITDDWIVSAGIAVALVAGTGYLLRKLGVPALLVPVAQLAVVILWLGVLVANDVALLGFIPTTDWAARLVDVFREGGNVVTTYIAPVPVPRGILLLLVGGAGVVALLVDALAVWLRRVPLAGLPLAACYTVAASVLAANGLQWWWFLPPAAGYLALLVSEGRTRVAAWGRSASPSARRTGIPETDTLARNGRRVGAVALAVAVAVPGVAPILTEGLLGPGSGGGGGGGQTIRTDNPIVDLQRNLQRRENVEVLRYHAQDEEEAYIRIVTLDVFDGEEWKTSDRPVPDSVENGLPWPQGLNEAELPLIEYDIRATEDFSSSWLPLPYPTQQIEIEGGWRYHAATLDVVADGDNDVRARRYIARSLQVVPTVEALRGAGPPSDDVQAMLALPDDLPPIVTELATGVTDGATDDFSRAAALQDWFRGPEGGFRYDIEAESGHSATALEDFLTERTGYCEQFAATMAIMARYLGIPARVAVGFTPGDALGNGNYLVRSHDAHAWPELYFQGSGWVRFEPTPASITGLAPDWTVVPNEDPNDPNPDPSAPVPSSTSTTAPIPRDEELTGAGAAGGAGSDSQWPLMVLGGLALAGFFLTPAMAGRLGRQLRWRRAGDDPAASAEAAWADLREATLDAGLAWDPAATPRTTGQRIAKAAEFDDDERQLVDHLVGAIERARYAPHAEPVEALRADTDLVRRSIARSASPARRVASFLLPTRLRDAASEANRKVIDALDWVDHLGDRMRTAATSATTRRRLPTK